MKISKVFIFIASLVIAGSAGAAKYKIDEGHSAIGFKIRHLGISNVKGSFKKFSGTGNYDAKSGKINGLDVTIQAESIFTNEDDRDKHLRSGDFFETKKFKTITFKSTKVTYNGKTPEKIHGKLTIRGITHPIVLEIEDWGGTATDPWGNERIAFEAEGKIDRTKFGLKWNKGLKKAAGLLVGNKVKLEIAIEGMKTK